MAGTEPQNLTQKPLRLLLTRHGATDDDQMLSFGGTLFTADGGCRFLFLGTPASAGHW
jgi:hypothetical protein